MFYILVICIERIIKIIVFDELILSFNVHYPDIICIGKFLLQHKMEIRLLQAGLQL